MALSPVLLAVNTPQRFYRGGRRILGFRGTETPESFDDRRPEDWLASTTRLFAEGGDGLTVLPDGRTLRDALAEDPQAWLGEDHVREYGAEPGLLVKLLDAAERLPVHTHPDRAFAARHLDCPNGKTEAWLVLDSEPGAMVWLGFRDDVSEDRLAELVDAQDDRLLETLNGFQVSRGDAVLVPAGLPHAIGAGVFVVELQEPTDFSVMLEHERFGLDADQSWLGLDRAQALRSVTRDRLSPTELAALCTRWEHDDSGRFSVLPARADEFFRADVLLPGEDPVTVEAGFSVLVVVAGSGRLSTAAGDDMPLRKGQTVLTPYSCGDLTVAGQVTAIRARPGRTTPPTTGEETSARTISDLEATT